MSVLAFTAALISPASAAIADNTSDGTADVDGTVYAITSLGDRTILGGDFSSVGGLPRSNVAALLPDGSVDPDFVADTDGVVRALGADEALGRVYIGGAFSTINGIPRSRLGAVGADGSVDTGWVADAAGIVYGIDTHAGRVYAGGTFRSIGGVTIRRLAAIDAATGQVDTTFSPWPDWTVKAVVVSPDGSRVYAVGGFKRIAGVDRNGVAELSADTGKTTTFDPSTGGVALAAALSPDGTQFLYATTDNVLHVYEPAVSNTPRYVLKTSGDTQAIGVSDSTIYIGGHFSRISAYKARRVHMAALDLADGSPLDWNPNVNGRMGVWAVLVSGDAVHIGGDFNKVNRKTEIGYASFLGTP